MAADIEVIWVRQKQKYFCKWDWTKPWCSRDVPASNPSGLHTAANPYGRHSAAYCADRVAELAEYAFRYSALRADLGQAGTGIFLKWDWTHPPIHRTTRR